ncbi:competence protein comGF [Mesobacillus subterraneus]|uniref:Competence protein comGF n=2 Tax=Mesobacillus subterraneus TaxID=285983 RepID=A0A427TSU8_9BACI|nr:competence protein comGF [Mesobacillus subterraneus]
MVIYKPKDVQTRNERGFTMLEMVISLAFFMIIVSMLPIGFSLLLNNSAAELGIRQMEWEVFSSQVKKEIRTAEQIMVQPDKLLLTVNGQTVLYEKYGSGIRRRVNYQGHEILVQSILTCSFQNIIDGVEITAVDLNGKTRSVRVHQFYQTGSAEL